MRFVMELPFTYQMYKMIEEAGPKGVYIKV
jgi:hypothetical protein